MKNRVFTMKIFYLAVCLFIFQVTVYSQWARLKTPQSDVLGQKLVGRTLAEDSVPQSAIVTKDGANEQTEFVKKDIETNFELGTFEYHKFRNVVISGVKVDYIDFDYLKQNPNLQNSWRVYKGLRANEVKLYFDRTAGTEITPAMLINALEPRIKNFTKVEDIKFDFSQQKTTTVTITNPNVYFRVQIARLELVESNTVAAFDDSNASSYKLSFPNNKDKIRTIDLGNNVRPRFQLALEKDSTGELRVLIYLPDDFARANNLTNPYVVEKKNIGSGILEYRMLDKTIGVISRDKKDYFVKIVLEGIKNNENEVEFKHWSSPVYRTAIRFPYAKLKFNNIKEIE